MAAAITEGMMVKVEVPPRGKKSIPVETTSLGPRTGDVRRYHHDKTSARPGHFLFGTVDQIFEIQKEVRGKDGEVTVPARYTAMIRWAGPRHRTSTLPVELLTPAVNQAKRM